MSTVTLNGVRVNDANANTGWANFGGGGPAPAAEPQLAYQKPNAVNRKVATTTSRTGVAYSGTGQDMSGSHPLWICKGKVADAGDLNTTYGVEGVVGSGSGAHHSYNLSGSGANNDQFLDGYNSQGGLAEGYIIAAINPNIAQWREGTTGSPNLSSVSYFAFAAQFVTGGAKSENLALDAIDVVTGLDYSGTVFTFQDAVDADQLTDTNRWGLACQNGSVISLRGLHRLGSGASLTGTDSSIVIFPDGYHGTGDCGIETNTGTGRDYGLAGSYIGLGRLYTNDDTRPDLTSTGDGSGAVSLTGTFDNFRLIELNAAHTVTSATLNCSELTQGGAAITETTIQCNAASGVAVCDDPDFVDLTDCLIEQVGSGHAFEITSPGTYTLDALTFAGFGANGANDAAIYNNSGGAVTLTIIGGGNSPTVRNGTGASTTVSNPATVTFIGIPNGLEGRVRKGAVSLYHEQSITGNQFVYAYTYTADEVVTVTFGGIAGDGNAYNRQTFQLTLEGGNVTIPLSFELNPSYTT